MKSTCVSTSHSTTPLISASGHELSGVELISPLAHEPFVHADRLEVAQLTPERAIHERLGRIEADAPEARTERPRDVERRVHRVVLVVDEHCDVRIRGR